jgi:methionine salvage enolase-phosphatase E1
MARGPYQRIAEETAADHHYFLSDLPEGIGAFSQLGLTIVMPSGRSHRCLFCFWNNCGELAYVPS